MTSNTYASKKAFHDFSRAASSAFNTKLSTVQQKLAKQEGYKNTNALLASLPDEAASVTPKQFEVSELTPNDIYKEPWASSGTFTATAVDGCFMLRTTVVTAPLYLTSILNGKVFEDPEILCQPLYIEDMKQADSHTHIWIQPPNFKAVVQRHLIFPVAVIQSTLNPDYIITSEEALKAPFVTNEGSTPLASWLISEGSVKQFSAICRMPKLVEELGLSGQVTKRYFNQILSLCCIEGECRMVRTGMPYLDQTNITPEYKNSVIRDLAHPLEAVEGDAGKVIVGYSDDVSAIKDRLRFFDNHQSLSPDSNLDTLEEYGGQFLYSSRIKLQKKVSNRHYELSELENNLLKHLVGFFKMYEKHVYFEIMPLKGIEWLREEIVNYHAIFSEMYNLLADVKLNPDLLTIKTGLKEGRTVLSIILNESISSLEHTMSKEVSDLQPQINKAQQLFKSIPDDLLSEHCYVYDEFESIPLKKGTYTFSEALGIALKYCRANQPK